jgi:hypothetical protein
MSIPSSVEKGLFIFSVAVLAYLAGFVARWHDWFPSSYIEQASAQVTRLIGEMGAIDTQERVYERRGVRAPAPAKMQPGLTLVASHWTWKDTDHFLPGLKGLDTPVEPGMKLIDRDGQTVHEWHPDVESLFETFDTKQKIPARVGFEDSYLFPNGDLLFVLEYIGAVRINSCGEVLWRTKEGIHHYFSRAEDGSFWMAGTSLKRRTTTDTYPDGFLGIDKPVWLDQVLNVTAEGEVRKKINILDVLYENDLERYIVKGLESHAESVPADVVHLNDVESLPSSMAEEYPLFDAGDLVVSLRRPSLVFVFDPESGAVKWHEADSFLHQHDPDFTGEGWIGVFDNNYDLTDRGKMLGGSRIVSLQPHTDSTRIRFPTEHSDPFYTSVQGQWQELENGNILLAERDAGRVVEVGPDGRTVWEWIHPQEVWEIHSDEPRVPNVTGVHRYDLTREEMAAWECSSLDSLQATR